MHQKEDSPEQVEEVTQQQGHQRGGQFVVFERQLVRLSCWRAHAVEGERQERPEDHQQHQEAAQDKRQQQQNVVFFEEFIRLVYVLYSRFYFRAIAAEHA